MRTDGRFPTAVPRGSTASVRTGFTTGGGSRHTLPEKRRFAPKWPHREGILREGGQIEGKQNTMRKRMAHLFSEERAKSRESPESDERVPDLSFRAEDSIDDTPFLP